MPKSQNKRNNWLQTTAVRVGRVHFAFVATYMLATIIFDSWNLYTHQAVSLRWTASGVFLSLTAIVWYLARMKYKSLTFYSVLVLSLVAAGIIFAGLNVYWERGLASKSVILFALPLMSAATLRSRSTLLTTAAVSTAVYSTAAVRYFYQHYGESYRVELYGYLAFYCALFFIAAWLLWIVIKPTSEKFS